MKLLCKILNNPASPHHKVTSQRGLETWEYLNRRVGRPTNQRAKVPFQELREVVRANVARWRNLNFDPMNKEMEEEVRATSDNFLKKKGRETGVEEGTPRPICWTPSQKGGEDSQHDEITHVRVWGEGGGPTH